MPTAKQLTIETANLDDEREMDEFDRQVIAAGMSESALKSRSYSRRVCSTRRANRFSRNFPATCRRAPNATSVAKWPRHGCLSSPAARRREVFSVSLSKFAERTFNADDRAAELNSGSYQDIPLSIRAIVNREFEEFIRANIRSGKSFALETTLRSSITFDQAMLARENGSV